MYSTDLSRFGWDLGAASSVGKRSQPLFWLHILRRLTHVVTRGHAPRSAASSTDAASPQPLQYRRIASVLAVVAPSCRPCSASSAPTSSPTPNPARIHAAFAAVASLAAAPSASLFSVAVAAAAVPPALQRLPNAHPTLQPSSYHSRRLASCRVLFPWPVALLFAGYCICCSLFGVRLAASFVSIVSAILSAILSALIFVPFPMSMPLRSLHRSPLSSADLSLSVPLSVPRSLSSPSLCRVPCPCPSPCSSVDRVVCCVAAISSSRALAPLLPCPLFSPRHAHAMFIKTTMVLSFLHCLVNSLYVRSWCNINCKIKRTVAPLQKNFHRPGGSPSSLYFFDNDN